jgi:hypothetical protein
MTDNDTLKNNILMALWNLLSEANLSETILIGNRRSSSKLSDFVVLSVNGRIRKSMGYARCNLMVQLFAKDADNVGTENMTRITQMSEALLAAIPRNTHRGVYTFNAGDEIGRRGTLGYHSVTFDVACLIN